MQPQVTKIKCYAVLESVVEAKCAPGELDDFLRDGKFTGTADLSYLKGGRRTIVTKEHLDLTIAELDEVLKKRVVDKKS